MEQLSCAQKIKSVYSSLNTSQKMYVTLAFVTCAYFLCEKFSIDNDITLSVFYFTILQWWGVILCDLLGVYKKIYATLLGKGFVLVAFSLCSAFTFAVDGQIINNITGVEPSRFINTTIILAVFSIPGVMLIIMAGVFIICLVVLPLSFLYFSIGREFRWILLPYIKNTEEIQFFGFTRMCQIASFLIFCSYINSSFQSFMNTTYSEFVVNIANKSIYYLEMYEKSPCMLPPNTRGVLIDDEHVLVARNKEENYVFHIEQCNYRIIKNSE
ncbi:hypothetical protein LJS09_000525 [Salmonella enterica]|nr:hypothetical protein [Salmonella enterica]